MEIHDPGNKKQLHIIYALLSEDKDGNEGILGAKVGGQWMPAVSGDLPLLEKLAKRLIRDLKLGTGYKYKLVSFDNKKEIKRY